MSLFRHVEDVHPRNDKSCAKGFLAEKDWQIGRKCGNICIYQKKVVPLRSQRFKTWKKANLIIFIFLCGFSHIHALLITILLCHSCGLKYWEPGHPQPDAILSRTGRLQSENSTTTHNPSYYWTDLQTFPRLTSQILAPKSWTRKFMVLKIIGIRCHRSWQVKNVGSGIQTCVCACVVASVMPDSFRPSVL